MALPFVAEVKCDVVEDKFVIHLPPFDSSDLMMGKYRLKKSVFWLEYFH